MQPSFVGASYNMAIPFLFAKNHLRLSKHEDVILKVQDERIWPARYYYRKYKGCSQTRFEWGWKAFAIDNDLKVGDVCVFVKRKNIGILLFEVVTLYKNEVPNSSVLPAANNRTSCVKVEPSFTSNNYDKASMISHDIIAKKEVIEPSDKVCGESPVPEKFIRNQKLSRKDKAEAFQRVKDFKSEDPFFIVPMQPSSVGSKSRYNLDGRTWSAKYYVHVRPHGISSTFRIESGWKAFVQDNDLKVGDVCAFVFRKSIGRILFEVVIFHNNGVANSPMAMLPIPGKQKLCSVVMYCLDHSLFHPKHHI
ncbi:B3 domain-containing protein Os03g0619600 isoform X3 [Cannabis sativa]|uniref:B3 domain-containing protein Os03g0619600 isoform X3 n=1 Tax=Cannabis sativa TaxID=3483 RepID=UPI0029CA6418|nr:B3 domain-containing protein Os03g0619600 isoform X3 [Cannabis sativa]